MILEFPNLQAVRLALLSGAVPEAVRNAPAGVSLVEDGRVLIRPDEPLSRGALGALRQSGVVARKDADIPAERTVGTWLEVFPLQRDPVPATVDEKAAVLFELPDESLLSDVAGEMLRLGNDRQSFRYLADEAGRTRVLLRVIGPPYYSLLRALDRNGDGDAPRAYFERHPRVWVEAGFQHPLADRIQPPPGHWLLIGAPHEWRWIDEAPLRDVYEVLEFPLPAQPAALRDIEWDRTLPVPLRLVRGSAAEAGELWVLDGEGIERLEEFVQGTDQRLLERLAFAAGELDGRTVVVVRVRPGRQAAPVLVLDGLACRSYLKLPNLFVPVGLRLQPPLRRDVVKRRLADDESRIVWLQPTADGRFATHSLPDSAFRPLSDWVEYVLDRDPQPLDAWVQSTRFAFEAFVCRDEGKPRKPAAKPPEQKRPKPEPPPKPAEPEEPPRKGLLDRLVEKFQRKPDDAETPTPEPLTERRVLEERLRTLEQRFLALDAPADAAPRRELWRDLARTNSRLEHYQEAAICWSQAVWNEANPSTGELEAWYRTEAAAAGMNGFAATKDAPLGPDIDDLLTSPSPSPSRVQALAVYLVWAAGTNPPHAGLVPRLGALQLFLEQYESYLSTRAAWLVACALFRLSGGDVLGLARARDRLLERLFQHGLTPERDLPGFLRASGLRAGDRFRIVREQVAALRDSVQTWSRANRSAAVIWTEHYIDLTFALALARLGEPARARELAESARRTLEKLDLVHRWLLRAYLHRITEALDGKPSREALPRTMLEELESMDRLARYKIDRLRQHSRILEPHEKIDPYRRWHRRYTDELSRELAELSDVIDRGQLIGQVKALLARRLDESQRVRVVATALELGPRLGDAVAADVLPLVLSLLQRTPDVVEQALLLEKGLFLAAHFDQTEFVQTFVAQLHALLQSQQTAELATVRSLGSLLAESFRGMRKLGMRDDIARLLDQMDAVVQQIARTAQRGKDRRAGAETACESMAMQLQVAAGWFYFGQDRRGWPVIERAGELLFGETLIPVHRTALAAAYATALGQAHVDQVLPRLHQMFERLRGISDTFTTNSHYSLSQLDVVEAVVLAMVSEDFTLDPTGRRWLDDDEFLVRRRIHHDVRTAMEIHHPND